MAKDYDFSGWKGISAIFWGKGNQLVKNEFTMMQSILRLPAVKNRTGLSRSTIYFRISQGMFPKPVNLGGRAVGWLDSEIQEWVERQIAASRGQGPKDS